MNDRIIVPDLCKKHQQLLVAQAGYRPSDPWQALIIATNIALFQAATTHSKTHERIGGDISRIGELGCLACYRPDAFGEIVAVSQKPQSIAAIKALGEKWVAEGMR